MPLPLFGVQGACSPCGGGLDKRAWCSPAFGPREYAITSLHAAGNQFGFGERGHGSPIPALGIDGTISVATFAAAAASSPFEPA